MKYIILLLLLQSCVTYEKCQQKYGNNITRIDTVFVHDTITVQGEQKSGEWSLEDLLGGDTLSDSSNRTTVTIWKYRDKIIHKWRTKDSLIYIEKKILCPECQTAIFKSDPLTVKWWWWLILAVVLFAFGYLIRKK